MDGLKTAVQVELVNSSGAGNGPESAKASLCVNVENVTLSTVTSVGALALGPVTQTRHAVLSVYGERSAGGVPFVFTSSTLTPCSGTTLGRTKVSCAFAAPAASNNSARRVWRNFHPLKAPV